MPKIICITNNPLWPEDSTKAFGEFEFVDGAPIDVFFRARDLVHAGWKFLGHPLYGNFNPAQVPYRTLVLEGPGPVDMESFAMLEKALEQFRGKEERERKSPLSEEMLRDYATVDYELMKETVTRYLINHLHMGGKKD